MPMRGFATMPLDMSQARAAYMKHSSMAVILDILLLLFEGDEERIPLSDSAGLSPNGLAILTSSLILCTMKAPAMPAIPRKHSTLHVVTYTCLRLRVCFFMFMGVVGWLLAVEES